MEELINSEQVNELVDYKELKINNFKELLATANDLKKKYANLIIKSDQDLEGLTGRNSVLSNLRSQRKMIDDARKQYDKEIKKRSSYPREQFIELRDILDETINDLQERIDDFESKALDLRKEHLKEIFYNILEEYETNGASIIEQTEFDNMIKFENFYKERFTNKSNHVNKMTDDGKRKFILKWINSVDEAGSKALKTVTQFAESNNLTLRQQIVVDKIEELMMLQLNNDELVDADALNAKIFNWLNEQLEIIRNNALAQKQAEEEKQRQLEAQRQAEQQAETENTKGSDANGGIVIEEPQQTEKQETSIFNITLEATDEQMGSIKETIIRIVGSDKVLIDKVSK